ncbi:MAG: RNA polymerase sporulation sigma factor SigK [Eubacteriales bacterium]|nr:RNA polymerase sporulation sigma factor SigK [Eubacteriales bacterium]
MLEILTAIFEGLWPLLAHMAGRSAFPRPLGAQEEKELVGRMLEGDAEAARLLTEHNLRLVAHIAKKYAGSGAESDDLVSVGSIGLMKAVASFRPECGKLSAYAARCVENEMLMYLRSLKKTRLDVSLSEPIGSDKEGNELHVTDILGTDADLVPGEVEERMESARAIRLMDRVLTPRERAVVRMRTGLADGTPRAQHEIAQALGISRSYVSRIEKKALEKLRRALESEPSRKNTTI